MDNWDRHFLGMALYHSRRSKDPATRVGCVITGPDHEVVSAGYNGFPRGVEDTQYRLIDRDLKLKLIVHAEMNAVLAAARLGIRLKGCTLYVACTDNTGAVWGGPPCVRCTVELLQVGIVRVVAYQRKAVTKWAEDLRHAACLLKEAGVEFEEGGGGAEIKDPAMGDGGGWLPR